MKRTLTVIASFISFNAVAQDEKSQISFGGYLETYYSYDFNKPVDGNKPSFIYSHNRHNEVNVNLALLKVSYVNERIRANLALMAGTYSNANLAAENGVLKNVYEASAGFKLSKTKNLWVDAGIFGSHIGFESAISKDCWTLTRSLLADNTPYYEAGAKLTYNSDNSKWMLCALLLNGWQRITRVSGNSTLGVGTQVAYKPSEKLTLNWSTFIGNDKPDSVKQMRYYNNFYGIVQLTNKLGVTVGFDYGIEQKSKGSTQYNNWYSPVFIARYAFSDKFAMAGRVEYYHDENGVIIVTDTENGFKTLGYSVNFDYLPITNVAIRWEGRLLESKDKIFTRDERAVNQDAFVTTSIAIAF
ncbi:porin [Solitalea sp. MAHUQ-68]|uniref:Porin n=1 Tax=Solitalea agri TaxID=2953739 RepID=A0A9X2F9H6_9SPHI|nr:porin [Solitalea agri]MCO4294288.1 porin [Solitalea agri]